MKTTFVIDTVLYPVNILISIGQTNDEFAGLLSNTLHETALEELKEDSGIVELPPTTFARTMMFYNTGDIVLRIPKAENTPEFKGVVAHEIFHMVELLFDSIDTPLTKETSEPYAYLITHITKKFYEHYEKALPQPEDQV